MFGPSRQVPSQHSAATVSFPVAGSAVGIGLISGVVNLLALTSPLFMLQIYDRVLASGSVPTLVGLAVLAAGLYAFQAGLDALRARVLLRIGERFDGAFSGRVYDAILKTPLLTRVNGDGLQPLRDLDSVRGFLGGNGPTAFFDLPWMPLYLGICFLFHFWIGVTALVGAVLLIAVTLLANALSQKAVRDVSARGMTRNALMEGARRNAEVVRAMGLQGVLADRWQNANSAYLEANRKAGDVSGGLGSLSRTLRIMLQSAILGVGAYLVIRQEVTAGVMIASSIMMGRALAPVDTAISNWRSFLMARQGWGRLRELLAHVPAEASVLQLPEPGRDLRVEGLAIVPPGQKSANLAGVSLKIEAGNALGVIVGYAWGRVATERLGAAGGEVRLDPGLAQLAVTLMFGRNLERGDLVSNPERLADPGRPVIDVEPPCPAAFVDRHRRPQPRPERFLSSAM